MAYKDLLARLWYPRQVSSSLCSSVRTRRILDLLGAPDATMRCIQVAGTNGKGTVAKKIAAGIRSSLPTDRNQKSKPMRVGLFTSRHINSFRERINVDGQPIEADEVADIMPVIWDAAEKLSEPLTRFDSLTLLALEHFRRREVQYAVLEAGVGGHRDSTNAVSSTMLSVITSVDSDGTHILGQTSEEIVQEKMGIIKSGQVAAILGPNIPPLDRVVRRHAQQKGVPVLVGGQSIASGSKERHAVEASFFSFEEDNCQTARTALEVLMDQSIVTPGGLVAGVAALPACRFEVLEATAERRATVVLDVAHNPAALKKLLDMTEQRFPDVPLRLVIGLSSKTEAQSCLEILSQLKVRGDSALHLVTDIDHISLLHDDDLISIANEVGLQPEAVIQGGSVEPTVRHALEVAGRRGEVVVICGPFLIMHSARKAAGVEILQEDPIDLH